MNLYAYAFSVLLLILGVEWPRRCLAQGSVFFSNLGASGGITNGLTWHLAEVGSTFQVALYFAQDGVLDESEFAQLAMPIGINVRPGYFNGFTIIAPTIQPAGIGMFQVRVWESAFGTTYEEAVANPNLQNGRLALAGESGILRIGTAGVGAPFPPPAILVHQPAIVGRPLDDGILLLVVPEPSHLPILLSGFAALVLLCRRFAKRAA